MAGSTAAQGSATKLAPALSGLPMTQPHDPKERQAEAIAEGRARPERPQSGASLRPNKHLVAGGELLPDAARVPLESKLGADFSGVRLHRDAAADALTTKLSARAVTVGADIFVNRREHGIASSLDRTLLTHELAHTLQLGGPELNRTILVEGEPWFEMSLIRDKFGSLGLELYLKMRDDVNPYLFPTEERLLEEIELRLEAVRLMKGHEGRNFGVSGERSCCRYPQGNEPYMLNPTYWDKLSNDPPAFKLADGKRSSEAIEAIFETGADSVMDCHTTIVAIRYRTELERLGADVFDAQYSGFNAPLISPYFSGRTNWSGGLSQHPLYSSGAVDRELVPYNADDPTANLLPGDHVYFKNHPAYGESGLWMGEHAMYIGGGLFVGFGASSIETITYADGEKVDHHKYAVTYDQMIEELRKQLREVNSDKSLDPIGLEDPENPGMIRVRRPKAPFLASE